MVRITYVVEHLDKNEILTRKVRCEGNTYLEAFYKVMAVVERTCRKLNIVREYIGKVEHI